MKRVLKEPLIHFLMGGALIFLIFAWRHQQMPERSDQIVVSSGQIDALALAWERTWRRQPTQNELDKIVEEYIREEVYYREALALGLERDDTIIRRRLRQKMEFLSEDFQHVADPGDTELQAFLRANPDRFRQPAVLSFKHIYFNPDHRGNAASAEANRVLAELSSETEDKTIETLGDPFFNQREFDSSSELEVARVFGQEFVPKLLDLKPGQWSGPLRSGFGVHLVFLNNIVEGRIPALEEIRERVLVEWQSKQKETSAEEFYRRLREQYAVTIEKRINLEKGEQPEAAQ